MLELRQQQQLHAWEHTPSLSHTSLTLLVRVSVCFVTVMNCFCYYLKVERILPSLISSQAPPSFGPSQYGSNEQSGQGLRTRLTFFRCFDFE